MTAGLLDDMTLDGLTVHSRRWVPAALRPDATPVLLVHGLGANTVAWVTVGQAIADRLGAAVTAIDLAGFGYTMDWSLSRLRKVLCPWFDTHRG